ncbi:MAG TPA: choice-of-anchor tandem repeat GloVer-containing protein [Rhizomicrobium sp.]
MKACFLFALGLLATLSPAAAEAAKYHVLYSFTGDADGGNPGPVVVRDAAGNLYGTTMNGGAHGLGTVFRLTRDGAESIVFDFADAAKQGKTPYTLSLDRGDLYGTTQVGGKVSTKHCNVLGCGVVFKLSTTGTFTRIRRLHGSLEGAMPAGSVVSRSDGQVYGTASIGGTNGNGIAYSVSNGTMTVLHNFGSALEDGQGPETGLIRDRSGNLYGTTHGGGGGIIDGGTLFKIDANNVYSVLHAFNDMDKGFVPSGVIVDEAGNFYGTTIFGGANQLGTIYKMTPDGTETLLYSFTGGPDGSYPIGRLVRDIAGNLYGETSEGGKKAATCEHGCGSIFRLDTAGTLTTLYRFEAFNPNGLSSQLAMDKKGRLYGTAGGGNTSPHCPLACGVVFELDP